MADRDCAICRGTGRCLESKAVFGELIDCPNCTPSPAETMRAALVAIQELHDKGAPVGPRWQCCECFHIWPCATRRLADDALTARTTKNGDNK